MDLFTFRKHLYWISNQLSSQEVENLKFMCNDVVPRRQLERLRSGFDLFCVLEGKNFFSPTNIEFLKEILETVGKDHLVKKLLSEGGGRAVAEMHEIGASTMELPGEGDQYDPSKLKQEFKRLLLKVGDELMERNVRDIAFFFQDPESLSLQEIEQLRSASKLFQTLQDQGIIGPTKLRKLRATLDVIGRKDVCKIIDDYQESIPQFVKCPTSTQVSPEGQHVGSCVNGTKFLLSTFCCEPFMQKLTECLAIVQQIVMA